MGFKKYHWFIILGIAYLVAYISSRNDAEAQENLYLAYLTGIVLGQFIPPFLAVGFLRLISFFTKNKTKESIKRSIFLVTWGFISFFFLIGSQRSKPPDDLVNKQEFIEKGMDQCKQLAYSKFDSLRVAKTDLNAYCTCSLDKVFDETLRRKKADNADSNEIYQLKLNASMIECFNNAYIISE